MDIIGRSYMLITSGNYKIKVFRNVHLGMTEPFGILHASVVVYIQADQRLRQIDKVENTVSETGCKSMCRSPACLGVEFRRFYHY